MDEVTAVLERVFTQRLTTVNRWREIGVDALEEATCGWFDMDMANDQIFRELQEHGTDEIINNRQNARAEDLKAALRQTDAFGSLLGIAADARNVVGEFSEQATKEGVRAVVAAMSLENRLRRLEGVGGACPLCEEARAALLESIVSSTPGSSTPRYCEGCGRDVRPTVFDLDELLKEGEGVRS